MFDKTWSWAGKFRRTNKNIGIDWIFISIELKLLIDDLHFQIEHHVYPTDELVARFHHRLVSIHPFSNGNGRHARMMADIILLSQGCKRFTWGNPNLDTLSTRRKYIESLRMADKKDYEPLLKFVRSL